MATAPRHRVKQKNIQKELRAVMSVRMWNKTPNFGLQNPKLKDVLVHLF